MKFGEFHDEMVIKYDDKFKSRKVNIKKKWDQRNLKLPVDLQLDVNRFLFHTLASGLPVRIKGAEHTGVTICNDPEDTLENDMFNMATDGHHFGEDDEMMHNDMPMSEENCPRNISHADIEVYSGSPNAFNNNDGNGNGTIK